MGEFDLSLIHEFRNRPAFYDRNSPLFKDKLYTAHEWQEISNKLGYDVSLLKDRMLQLRNRYNLEKRRLEEIRERIPDQSVESQWPLFEQLHFLSEHIRSRRSYKNLLLRSRKEANSSYSTAMEPHNTGSNDSGTWPPHASNGASVDTENVSYPNGMLTVKVEEPDADVRDRMVDDESDSNTSAPYQKQQQQQQQRTSGKLVATAPASNGLLTSIRIRRLDTMQSAPQQRRVAKRLSYGNLAKRRQQQPPAHQQSYKRPAAAAPAPAPAAVPAAVPAVVPRCIVQPSTKRLHLMNACDQKYAAFGEFISSSLLELSPALALQLVDKFTTEVVRMLMQKNDSAFAAAAALAATATATVVVPNNNAATTAQINSNEFGQ